MNFRKEKFREYISTLCILMIISCDNTNNTNNTNDFLIENIIVTEPIISFYTEKHASEGVIFYNGNNQLINVFRYDKTRYANHIGNTSNIVARELFDDDSASGLITLVDNSFDARNISISDVEGTILLQYRNYDVNNPKNSSVVYRTLSNDLSLGEENVIYSYPDVLIPSTSPGVKVSGNKYLSVFYRNNYIEILNFDKQNNRFEYVTEIDYTFQDEYILVEPVIEYLGDNLVVMLARDNSKNTTSNPLISFSYDNGESFNAFERTNLAEGLFCSAPSMKRLENSNIIITICADRRSVVGLGQVEDEVLWVYANTVDDFYKGDFKFNLIKKIKRKVSPNNQRFYGYPSIISTKYGALVIYTDNFYDQREVAKLYQFKIRFSL